MNTVIKVYTVAVINRLGVAQLLKSVSIIWYRTRWRKVWLRHVIYTDKILGSEFYPTQYGILYDIKIWFSQIALNQQSIKQPDLH